MTAIDRDPTQEAILYQPQGWPSRTATGPLADDRPVNWRDAPAWAWKPEWGPRPQRNEIAGTGPLSNVTFAKNAIASGSIVPPAGEGASVRRTDWWVGLAVLVLIGLAFISVAFLWRA